MNYTAILELQPYLNLREEYQIHQTLFDSQPLMIRHYLSLQSMRVARAIMEQVKRITFSLPDAVLSGDADLMLDIPSRNHESNVSSVPILS